MATFDRNSTAEQVATAFKDGAAGRTVVITGGSTGLGFETARVLAVAGARVIVTCRSPKSVEETVARLRAAVAGSTEESIRGIAMDLSSLASVRAAAEELLGLNVPVNVLINNAGTMANPLEHTKDGLEMQFGVNHIGHFFFTTLLLDKIKASAPARIITVSSIGHYVFAPPALYYDDLDGRRSYDRWRRYGQSKLANVLFTTELQRRVDESGGADVTCMSLHPGNIPGTDLGRNGGALDMLMYLHKIVWVILHDPFRTVPQGAATQVFCAIAPIVVKGEYYVDCGVESRGHRHPLSSNAEEAKKLWDLSVSLVADITKKLDQPSTQS